MSHFMPDLSSPTPRQKPLEVARDTYVIRALTPSVGGSWTNLNAMVIRGAEPIAVDAGMGTHRDSWFEDLFSLVDPEELRWIFLTHLDCDHSGNLVETLERCPNARVISSRGESFRVNASMGVPFERMRLLDDGEVFEIAGRKLQSLRPPVYDSPYTRGLFDHATRVYYASDAFCAPIPGDPVDWVEEIAPDLWAEGMARFHYSSLCPWVALADRALFRAEVERLGALGMEAIVSGHSPAIRGASVGQALELLARLPDAVPAPLDFAELTG